MVSTRKLWKALIIIILITPLATRFLNAPHNLQSYGLNTVSIWGRISENTTWTLVNSPYVITDDIIVESGAKLTIESGVSVRFDGDFSIIVNGTLRALGTESNPVVFISNRLQPNAGDWNTIKFIGTQNESFIMTHAIVEHAKNGITIQSAGNATIENSRISNNMISGVHVIGKCQLTLRANILEFNVNGISSDGEEVSGIDAIFNSIKHNENGIDLQARASQDAIISNITILCNEVSSNKNGVYLYIWAGSGQAYDTSLIRNVLISENIVSFNNGYGILLYSGGPWYGSIYSVFISENRILSNKIGVCLYANTHYEHTQFDVTANGNTISENSDKGLYISGGVSRPIEQGIRTNITTNSISYNGYGVLYEGDTENIAHSNDIYANAFGMNVTDHAKTEAENNYWGDSNGPYHPFLNPVGRGNSVNGDGLDLGFIPFLSSAIVVRPIAKLEADKTSVAIDEIVTFDAAKSSDDGHVNGYLFDFGDHANSGWTANSVVTHAYASTGSYVASLSVVDDLGLKSNNTAALTLVVQRALTVSIDLSAEAVGYGENLLINVHVTDESNPVSEAEVALYSSDSGVFRPTTGRSNATGDFAAVFVGFTVTERAVVDIVANATKEGYLSGQGRRQVTILPQESTSWSGFLLIVAAVVALAVLIIICLGKRRKAK